MTRKSKREIERAVDGLDDTDDDDDTLRVVIQRDRVDENGEVVETNRDVSELRT